MCDFGGSGTSITLVDAVGEYQPLGPTVRHPEFSGDLLDQALLTAVMANLPSMGSFGHSGTSAIGSLARLRAGCRIAKEQLSSGTVTTLLDEVQGSNGDIRVTRTELDDAIGDSLTNFTAFFEKTLGTNGIRGSDLAAVVSVGGGANLPVVTTMLSGRLRVPVVTTPRPQLTAAIGGALRAARGPGDTGATTGGTGESAGRGRGFAFGGRTQGHSLVLVAGGGDDRHRDGPAAGGHGGGDRSELGQQPHPGAAG